MVEHQLKVEAGIKLEDVEIYFVCNLDGETLGHRKPSTLLNSSLVGMSPPKLMGGLLALDCRIHSVKCKLAQIQICLTVEFADLY